MVLEVGQQDLELPIQTPTSPLNKALLSIIWTAAKNKGGLHATGSAGKRPVESRKLLRAAGGGKEVLRSHRYFSVSQISVKLFGFLN